MSDDLAALSAVDLVALFRRKAVSPVDVARSVLRRIDDLNPVLNAICLVDEETTLEAAKVSEERWMKGEPRGLVDGVPTTIKDTVLTRGWPTRYGSKTVPSEGAWDVDAPPTARLREHGAVIVGKTTAPEFGWKGVTDNPLNGITRNPWDTSKTPGGSSGGAAAAAAAGMGALHLGGDGGGSIRIPAAFTGTYGLKPSYGRVPLAPYSLTGPLNHQGPMTRTVADAALMLRVIAEPDARDWSALPYSPRDWRLGIDQGVHGLRVGFSRSLGYAEVDPSIAGIVEDAVKVFEELGAIVEEADPGIDDPKAAFELVWKLAFARRLSSITEQDMMAVDPGLRAIVDGCQDVPGLAVFEVDAVRSALCERMATFHQRHDILVTPQMPIAAFDAGIDVPRDRHMHAWWDWTPFTYPFNLTQQPAASVPCGFTEARLPVALQIVGPRYRDDLVLRASRAYEAARPFAMPPIRPVASVAG